MTPDLDQLLADIKEARQQPGMNAWWQDVLKRSHRAICDLRRGAEVNKAMGQIERGDYEEVDPLTAD